MVASRQLSRWRRSAAASALCLSALLVTAALLVGGAATAAPWTALQAIPIPVKQHAAVWKVVGNPIAPQDLVAATSRGVWISADDGKTWATTSVTGFTWAVAFADAGATLYAGTVAGGIYRSIDGGQTWKQENAGLHSRDVRAIAVGPTAIVLGTQAGVYVSGDGTAWEQAGLNALSISSVAIIADNPLGVVAGSDETAQAVNLYRSLAVGAASGWQALPGGDPGGSPVFSLAAGPIVKGGTVPPLMVGSLKGLYYSSDGGNSWQARTLAGGALWSVDAIAFDPDNPAVIYVGGDNGGSSGGGLQRTINGGSSWAAFEQGLPSREVTGLSALSTDPLTVLASVWHPIRRVGGSARALDTTAPGPVALASTTGTPISVVVSPTPKSTSTPRPHHSAAGKGGSISAGLVIALVAILVVVVIALLILVRRRRRRLDAEAPP
ncbi:MAG: hypothetical protein WA724_04385 [Candidatus Dormiibacterota bacterium]